MAHVFPLVLTLLAFCLPPDVSTAREAASARSEVNSVDELPKERSYYKEYTVPTPGARDRGARRIIAGRNGEYFYTDDHYRSFRKIRE